MIRKAACSLLIFLLVQIPSLSFADVSTADQSLRRLKEGNQRYSENKIEAPRRGPERREQTKSSQTPFCTLLSCSDSRVPVEIIFDQGVGDIFVVRVAGNVANTNEIGSMEYSVEHLDSHLIVVLGHTNCGAVKAALTDAHVGGSISHIVDSILPAVQKARKNHPDLKEKELLNKAVEQNVWQSIEDIYRMSPEIAARVKAGELKIVGAIYDIESGKVEWLGEHPE